MDDIYPLSIISRFSARVYRQAFLRCLWRPTGQKTVLHYTNIPLSTNVCTFCVKGGQTRLWREYLASLRISRPDCKHYNCIFVLLVYHSGLTGQTGLQAHYVRTLNNCTNSVPGQPQVKQVSKPTKNRPAVPNIFHQVPYSRLQWLKVIQMK